MPQAIYAQTSNFGLRITSATVLSTTITVPAGFTSAAVSVVGRAFAINSTTSVDYLYADARIAGTPGHGLPIVDTASNGSALNVAPYSKVLTGLTPGSTFVIAVNAATSFASWAADSSNSADLSGIINWYR